MPHAESADHSVRLNKYIATHHGLSRRQADDYIAGKQVTINGEVAVIGARVHEGDRVELKGQVITPHDSPMTIVLDKPVGYVCSRRAQGDAPTIYDLLPAKYQTLKTVGRLDKDSSGVILLTNDGDLAHRLTHPKFHKIKIYEVELNTPLQPLHRQMISDFGVMLEDGKSQFELERLDSDQTDAEDINTKRHLQPENTRAPKPRRVHDAKPDKVATSSAHADTHWRITMHEGRNRQIRRTFAALGYKVTALRRTQFGEFTVN